MNDAVSGSVEHSVLIPAAPGRVLGAFFDAAALAEWWQVVRSVTTPRTLGVYAVDWGTAGDDDDVLGRLGGVFYGTIVDFVPGKEVFIADAWWLPPDGDPLGPMALEIHCVLDGPACRLTVRQSGFGDGPRWARYREVVAPGWRASLAALKALFEPPSGPSA